MNTESYSEKLGNYADFIIKLPLMAHAIDSEGRLIIVSDFWLKKMGYERDEVIGRKSTEFLSEKSKQLAENVALPEFHKKKFIENVSYQFIRKDTTIIEILLSADSILDDNGTFLCSLATIVDVTEQLLAEDALIESEKTFQIAMEATNDGLYDWNLATNEIYYSPGWKRMLGYQENELPNDLSIWETLTEPEDVKKSLKMQQELITQKRNRFKLEFKMKHKDGHLVYILSRAKAIFDHEGNAIRIVGTHVDITERIKANKELKKSEEKFRALFEQSGGYCMILDPNIPNGIPVILDANEAACLMHGYKRDELIGKTIVDLDDEDGKRLAKKRTAEIMTGKPFYVENEHVRKDGTTFSVSVNAQRIDIGNNPPFIITTEYDITERKQVEAENKKLEYQLQQAAKLEALGTLAGGIAHDFNNILSAILGHGQMALEELSPSSNIYEDIQQIMVSGNRAADLIKQIMLFSRQEDECFQTLPIQQIIQEAVGMFGTALSSSITFSDSIDWDCGSVHADPTQIHQVVMNLCTNARQAIQDDYGSISIALSEVSPPPSLFSQQALKQTSQKYACIEVRDSGCGMPPEIQSKVFDPFFTTRAQEKGTGLGLSVVDAIIRKHQGLISFESSSKIGTVFQVYLPIVDFIDSAVILPNNFAVKGHERILLVDDESTLIELHKRSLEKFGYQVTCFSDSFKALIFFQNNSASYDMIVTDMTMPKLTGLDLIKEIHRIRPEIKSILCTGYSKSVTKDTAESFGVNAYLEKPFLPSELAQTIRKVIDHG